MTFSKTWDETAPSDSQAASLGAQDFRDLETALRERSAVDHYYLAIEGGDAKIGFHNKVSFVDQISDLSGVSGATVVYGKTIAGFIELFLVLTNGTVIQLTTGGGKLNVAALSGIVGVTQGGTGLSSLALGDILYASALNTISALNKSTDGMGLVQASNIPTWAYTGHVVQIQETKLTSQVTLNSAIPADDTIPQKTEGVEVFTVSITPKNANNLLIIESNFFCGIDFLDQMVTALFKDTDSDALAAWIFGQAASGCLGWFSGSYYFGAAGGTSAITFKIRAGGAGTAYVNGTGGTRLFGGKAASYIRVTEIGA